MPRHQGKAESWHRFGVGLAFGAWLLFGARSSAHAAPRIVWLWPAEAACQAPQNADDAVAELIGDRAADARTRSFVVDVTLVQRQGYLLSFGADPSAPEARRRVQFASCDEVREAAILFAAMVVDPELRSDHGPSEREPGAGPAPPQRAFRGVQLEAALAFDARVLPDASWGPAIGVHALLGPLDIGVRGLYLAPQSTATLVAGRSAAVDLAAAALELRAELARGRRLSIGPSAAFELGYLRASVPPALGDESSGVLWSSAQAGLHSALRFHARLALLVRAAVGIPLSRPRFALRDAAPFFTTQPWTVRVDVGLSWAFGPKEVP